MLFGRLAGSPHNSDYAQFSQSPRKGGGALKKDSFKAVFSITKIMVRLVSLVSVCLLLLLAACTSTESSIETPSQISFQDFTNLPYSFDKSAWDAAIETDEYEERMFYNLFNQLNSPNIKSDTSCIQNQETDRCRYYFSILNNREDLCDFFPNERLVELCSRPGCSNVTVHYRNSCIVYVHVYAKYRNADDKSQFCNSFEEKYVRDACNEYTDSIT